MSLLPFTTDAMNGLADVDGRLRLEEEALVLEFETKVIGLLSTGTRQEAIPLGELEATSYRRRAFGGTLVLELRSVERASRLPGNDRAGRVALKVRRRDRAEGERFHRLLARRLAEHKLASDDRRLDADDLARLLEDQ